MKKIWKHVGLALGVMLAPMSLRAVTVFGEPVWTISTETTTSFIGSVTAGPDDSGEFFPANFGDLPQKGGFGLSLGTPLGVGYALTPVANPGLTVAGVNAGGPFFGTIDPGSPDNPFLNAPGSLTGEYFNTASGNHVHFSISTWESTGDVGPMWNADFAFNVAPVPEPVETAFCALLGLGAFAVWRRWRRGR